MIGSNFYIGITDPVSVDFNASCCVRTAELVAIDQMGNSATCGINLPPLTGDSCETLEVYNIQAHTVDANWTRPCDPYIVDFYDFTFTAQDTMTIDLQQEYYCTAETCTEELISGLRACVDYVADLVAHEKNGNTTTPYPPEPFTTLEDAPSAVMNLLAFDVGATFISLRWNTPNDNEECVEAYRVCYVIETAEDPEQCDIVAVLDPHADPVEVTLAPLEVMP